MIALCTGSGRHEYQRVLLSWSRHIPLLRLPPTSLKVISPSPIYEETHTRLPRLVFPYSLCVLDPVIIPAQILLGGRSH